MGSQRLVLGLYRDLSAYLDARFRLTANAARSGDLIFRVDGRPCGIVNFGSTAARSRQEDHAQWVNCLAS